MSLHSEVLGVRISAYLFGGRGDIIHLLSMENCTHLEPLILDPWAVKSLPENFCDSWISLVLVAYFILFQYLLLCSDTLFQFQHITPIIAYLQYFQY